MAAAQISDVDLRHENARRKVCIICYRKAKGTLTSLEIQRIRDHIMENFDIKDSNLPAAICDGCHLQ